MARIISVLARAIKPVVGWAILSIRRFRTPAAAFAVALATILIAAGTVGAAGTQYAIGVPVCKRPATPHLAQCFAMRRVLVSKSTPGARLLVAGDGVAPAGSDPRAD